MRSLGSFHAMPPGASLFVRDDYRFAQYDRPYITCAYCGRDATDEQNCPGCGAPRMASSFKRSRTFYDTCTSYS